jgi:hypothetical protein
VTFAADTPAGTFLYVAGGANGTDFLADAWRAKLTGPGQTGAWEPAARLPRPQAGAGVVAEGRHVVVVAGKRERGKTSVADVVLGTVGDDGAIAWRGGAPLPAPRFHLTCVLARGVVFAIGGLGEDFHASATVWSAPIDANGDLGPWTRGRDLPQARSHHASFVWADRIYLVGGLRGDPTDDDHVQGLADVVVAHVGASGALGEWQPAGRLDSPLATHAAAVHGGYAWLFGGVERDVTANVRRARIEEDGTLGAWQIAGVLPSRRAHLHQVPIVNGFAFAVSGNGGNHVAVPDAAAARLD